MILQHVRHSFWLGGLAWGGGTKCFMNKWYRFAIGQPSSTPNSAIVNFANHFNNTPQRSNLFHISISNHAGLTAKRLDGGVLMIEKMRGIYKKDNLTHSYVDVRFKFDNEFGNVILYNYSCNICMQFQPLEEVPDVVEEGYTVQEIAFE